MSWRPNATGFEIQRMPSGDGKDFEIRWDNAMGEEDPDDPDESTPEDGVETFATLAECFTFGEGLLAAADALSEELDTDLDEWRRAQGGTEVSE